MARTFSQAAADFLRFPIVTANNLAGGPVTIVAILKRTATGGFLPVLLPHNSGGAVHGPGLILNPSSNNLAEFTTDGNVKNSDSTFTITSTDGWVLVAVAKAAGTVTPRFHKYVYSSDTWTHQNGGATCADDSAPGTTGLWRMAEWSGIGNYDGDIAAVGLFDSVIGDADIEALAFSLMPWLSHAPVGLWLLDQSAVTHKVVDFAGNSTESARGGTALGSSSVPVFNYGMRPWLWPGVPAAGGSTVSLQLAIAGQGALAAVISEDKRLQLSVAGVGALSQTLRLDHKLQLAIAGQGSVSQSVRLTERLQLGIAGVASFSQSLREQAALKLSVAAQAVVNLTLSIVGAVVDLHERTKTGSGQ